jgi:hypothetical protein
MKTKSKILLTLSGAFAMIAMIVVNVNAQSYFSAATVGGNAYSFGSTTVLNTGNDKRDLISHTFEVSVWDDGSANTPEIGWNVDNLSFFGTATLSYSDAFDPDVCLVQDGTYAYAIVVYWTSTGNGFYYDVFRSNGGNFAILAASPYLLQNGNFGTTINIDSDDNDRFAIVWDDSGQNIWCGVGRASSGPPAITACGINQLETGIAQMPDVAMFWNGTFEDVLITYVFTNQNLQLYINYQTWSALNNCTPTVGGFNSFDSWSHTVPTSPNPTTFSWPAITVGNGGYYQYPRIAAGSGFRDQWSVEVEDNASGAGGSGYYIVGFTNASNIWSGPADVVYHVYNDGVTTTDSPYNISSLVNLRPVVTYDNSSNYFFVGWTFYNISGNSSNGKTVANYPIVLWCDVKGDRVWTANYYKYWEVPDLATSDDKQVLSVAGRYVTDNLYTYYGWDNTSTTTDVWYKTKSQSSPPLRMENAADAAEDVIIFYPNPFSASVEVALPNSLRQFSEMYLVIYDITGKEILALSGRGKSLAQKISSASAVLEKGVYIFKISSSDSENQWREKLIKL